MKPRQLPKSIGCSKNFQGKSALATKSQVTKVSSYVQEGLSIILCCSLSISLFIDLSTYLFIYLFIKSKVQHWLHQLALELEERLNKDKEMASVKCCSCRSLFFFSACRNVQYLSIYLLTYLYIFLPLTPQNGRVAKLLTVGIRQAGDKKPNSFSRCFALARYEASKISSDGFAIIKSLNAAGSHQEAW